MSFDVQNLIPIFVALPLGMSLLIQLVARRRRLLAELLNILTLLMLASSMAREKPARTLRFVFLPMDRSPVGQNQWLTGRCLAAGERCVGIIGLRTMEKSPETGAGDWDIVAPRDADKAWWGHLSKGGSLSGRQASSPPSVWVTHAVFSPDAWVDKNKNDCG